MSIGLYDNALLDKLRNWTNNTNVSIVSPEESRRLFEMIADTNDDKPIQLPIISLKRPRGFEILNPVKTPLTFNGIALAKQEAGAVTLNAVPIRINYQIDVYNRYVSEADEYMLKTERFVNALLPHKAFQCQPEWFFSGLQRCFR